MLIWQEILELVIIDQVVNCKIHIIKIWLQHLNEFQLLFLDIHYSLVHFLFIFLFKLTKLSYLCYYFFYKSQSLFKSSLTIPNKSILK